MASTPHERLEPYRAKRDFRRTGEPSGTGRRKTAAAQGLRFVVQKHDATRLHFDFRLELDGVLKSWAVTRGPSLNPADKRLAVRVEDHPLGYATFEGTIPQGEYGGGTVMLWDEGTWEPVGDPHAGLEAGDLKFRLHGERMKGEWVLVHMKGRDSRSKAGPRENWLLIKHRDDHASESDRLTDAFTTSVETGRDLDAIANGEAGRGKSSATRRAEVWTGGKAVVLPQFRAPQLATLVEEIPAGDGWLFETKYDGYRCIAAIAGAEVRLYTRNGKDWTEQFGDLVAPLSRLTKGTALIDGEVCAFGHGRTDFSTLKQSLASGGRLTFFVFDLLEIDGDNIESVPLVERKERLRTLVGDSAPDGQILFSDHIAGHGQDVLKAMCEARLEGVIAKRADAPYRHDRTRSWLKIKCTNRQEFVIGGWRPSEKRKGFASLLLGTFEDARLVYRGRVGTGFTEASASDLQAELDRRATRTRPFDAVPREVAREAQWVRPELVAEVEFTEFTPDGHLRHPSFVGLRDDKRAGVVRLEQPAQPKPQTARRSRKGKAVLDNETGEAVAGRLGVRLTHADRPVREDGPVSKAQLAAYYDAVAERMLPHVSRRALSLVRVPQGGHPFFQKHGGESLPEQMKRVEIRLKDSEEWDHFYVDDLAGLVAGVQMNTQEFHIWGSHIDDVERADRIVFDIDPDEGLGFSVVRDAARRVRDTLAQLRLESFPMVTGGKGIHVIAPIEAEAEWPVVKQVCRTIAEHLADANPELFTTNIRKAERKGRMFVDYLRNDRGSTAIAPFSTRARPGTPCAVPVAWDELDEIGAANAFDIEAAARRASEPDPWKGYFKLRQGIMDIGQE